MCRGMTSAVTLVWGGGSSQDRTLFFLEGVNGPCTYCRCIASVKLLKANGPHASCFVHCSHDAMRLSWLEQRRLTPHPHPAHHDLVLGPQPRRHALMAVAMSSTLAGLRAAIIGGNDTDECSSGLAGDRDIPDLLAALRRVGMRMAPAVDLNGCATTPTSRNAPHRQALVQSRAPSLPCTCLPTTASCTPHAGAAKQHQRPPRPCPAARLPAAPGTACTAGTRRTGRQRPGDRLGRLRSICSSCRCSHSWSRWCFIGRPRGFSSSSGAVAPPAAPCLE